MVKGALILLLVVALAGMPSGLLRPSLMAATAPWAAPSPSAKPSATIPPAGATAWRAGAGGGESTVLLASLDPATVPNTGIETEITGFSNPPLGPLTSFQVGVLETIGAYDAVFGLFQNSSFGPEGFFEVFTSSTDQTVHLAYGVPTVVVPDVEYRFALTLGNGTTWSLTVNGQSFAPTPAASSFDFGVRQATDPNGIDFSTRAIYATGTATVVPALVTVPTAFAVQQPAGWYLPVRDATSFQGAPWTQWGIAGRNQSPALAPGELVTGSSIQPLSNGTALWSGGPVPVDVAMTLPEPTLTATLLLTVNATVRTPAGGPIPDVPMAISDDHGGLATSPTNLSGPDGRIELALVTPNVTAPVTDEVTVASAILGYAGSSTEPLTLTPSVRLVLTVTPGDPTVLENGSVVLTVRASSPGGAPAAGIALLVTSAGGGEVAPDYNITDALGRVVVTFLAGSRPELVRILAAVDQAGAWGEIDSHVRIVAPPPNPWVAVEPYIILALAVALAAAIVLALRRRKPHAMPELGFLRGGRPPPVARTGPSEGPDPTRTPPSEGSP